MAGSEKGWPYMRRGRHRGGWKDAGHWPEGGWPDAGGDAGAASGSALKTSSESTSDAFLAWNVIS